MEVQPAFQLERSLGAGLNEDGGRDIWYLGRLQSS